MSHSRVGVGRSKTSGHGVSALPIAAAGRAVWLFFALALPALGACSDAAPGELDEWGGSLPQRSLGQPDPSGPTCPEAGDMPSPFPADLARSQTAAAGTIAGSFAVSATGEAIYSMPLSMPPGR